MYILFHKTILGCCIFQHVAKLCLTFISSVKFAGDTKIQVCYCGLHF